jgi:hypothetical protein
MYIGNIIITEKGLAAIFYFGLPILFILLLYWLRKIKAPKILWWIILVLEVVVFVSALNWIAPSISY